MHFVISLNCLSINLYVKFKNMFKKIRGNYTYLIKTIKDRLRKINPNLVNF